MAELDAFTNAAVTFSTSRADECVATMLRSPFSAVPVVLGSAVLRLRRNGQSMEDAITARAAVLPEGEREDLLTFITRLRTLAQKPATHDDVLGIFAIQDCHSARIAGTAPCMSGAQEVRLGPEVESRNAEHLLQLADPPSALPRTAVPARKGHFSASSLNTYVECKRKWFYRYVCTAVEDKGSAASYYGTAFHSALEDLHKEFPQPAKVSAQTLRTKLQAYINGAFDRYGPSFETPIERELQRRRAQRTAVRYVDWLAAQAARAPFTVVGCELPAALELEGYEFIGYIDRLDQDDTTGTVSVIDYKTGSIARSAAEYRQKVLAYKEFQLPFYYWARTAQGDRVTRLALVPLKDATLDVTPISLEVVPYRPAQKERPDATVGTISIDDLERARKRMIELCAELAGGNIQYFEVTDDGAACRYCAYATACNDRPFPPEEVFAR